MNDDQFRVNLRDTVFLVEATSYEHLCLWREYAEDSDRPRASNPVLWRQENEGRLITVGSLAGMPVTLSVKWDIINNIRVMFYDSPSVVTDMRMIERWLDENTNCPKWDNGTRLARCDAMNFHLCLHAIEERFAYLAGLIETKEK